MIKLLNENQEYEHLYEYDIDVDIDLNMSAFEYDEPDYSVGQYGGYVYTGDSEFDAENLETKLLNILREEYGDDETSVEITVPNLDDVAEEMEDVEDYDEDGNRSGYATATALMLVGISTKRKTSVDEIKNIISKLLSNKDLIDNWEVKNYTEMCDGKIVNRLY